VPSDCIINPDPAVSPKNACLLPVHKTLCNGSQ
jgi:hypothetical protein